MKIIDLLNKIANGEEVPHFKVSEIEYYLNWRGNLLEREEGKPSCDTQWFIDKEWLNTEVEIIENTPKEETNVSEEQALFNNLTSIDQDYVIRIMKMLQQPIDYLKSKGE